MHVRGVPGAVAGLALLCGAGTAAAVTQAPIVGEIDYLQLDPAADKWAGGVMVVGGLNVILPRNLLIDLPANRLTLKDLFDQAPPGCEGTSGLARADACRAGQAGAIATVLANRLDSGQVVAGEVFIQKGIEAIAGVVTHLDHTAGFFVLNGAPGSSETGVMVRINEPQGRHTIQGGPGCAVGSQNCSPDVRFAVDADNYTVAFSTGYPLCIPSTVTGGLRTTGATADGAGDPLCPVQNREVSPVPDSTRYAPLRLGDSVLAEGNFETVNGVRFLSAWKVQARAALVTRDLPTQPDYLTLDEVIWDVPGFDNLRTRFLLIGFTTLPTSPVDVFGIHYDPDNGAHEVPLASTVNNPDTINQGLPPNPGGIFRIRYDVDFEDGVRDDNDRAPCLNLTNAGFDVCPPNPTTADELTVVVPVARDLVARTRRTTPLNPGVTAVDLRGRPAPHGEYYSPVGLEHPEFVEIDLGRLAAPFAFSGISWNLDRRLGPGGCDGPCETEPQPLDPFPFEELDPRAGAPLAAPRILAHWPFGPGDQAPWPPPPGTLPPLAPTPAVPPLCTVTTPPAPTLATVTPAASGAGTGGSALLTGSNFLPGTTCSFGDGIEASCTVVDETTLAAVFVIAPDAAPGPRDVTVTGPGGTATLAGAFTVTEGPVAQPAPLVTAVTPASAEPGATVSVILSGGNFAPDASCDFGPGITVTACSVLSAAEIAAALAIDAAATVGPRLVTVVNPDGQAGTLANGFAVVDDGPPPPPALVISGVLPAAGDVGTSLAVAIFGENFGPGASCSFGPGIAVDSCTAVSASRIDAQLSIAADAAAGPRDVGVSLPDGRTAGLAGAFTVIGPPPVPEDLFFDPFERVGAVLGNGWVQRGTWSTDGTARGLTNVARAIAPVAVPTDVVVEAKVNLTVANQRAGLLARADGSNFYHAVVRNDRVQLLRFNDGDQISLAQAPTTLAAGTWTDLRMKVTGTAPVVIEVFRDGVSMIQYTDASADRLTTGGVGVRIGGAEAWFDDFRVTVP